MNLSQHLQDSFVFTQNPYIAELNDFVLSNTVLAYNMAAVTSQTYFNETAENSVAIAKDDLLVKWYLSYNYPDWNILEYDSEQDAENAVRNGQVDCLVVDSGELVKYNDNKKFHDVFLMQPGNTSFAVKRGDSILMSILNKTLRTIPSSMLTGALSTYENSMRKVTLADFVKDNLVVVSVLFVSMFAVVLLIILNFLQKSLEAEAKAKQAAKESLELNKKLQRSQRELQTALQAAETASKAKTDFLSNMSHDIRTPMNAIVGLTSLMENDLDDPKKLNDYLGKLKSSSKHLLDLINEILDMNKIESGKATLNVKPFSMAEQVSQVDNVIRPQARARKQKFTIQTHNICHENIEGDATRLQQVLLNILSNAVKYTQVGGHIELDIEEMPRDGHYARYKFTVTDNGMGMSEEFQKHIYESFTRAESSVTNKVQGTGLGMAITKSIVNMMGGAISLESELGKGSKFEVVQEFRIDQKADDAVKQMSVLLLRCSDESFARIKDATENGPVSICRSTSPEETENILKTSHYDVVLVPYLIYGDLLKPAVEHLRKLAGDETILIGIAAASRDEALDTVQNCGLDGFISLPFFLSNLEAEVEDVREHRSRADEPEKASVLVGMNFLCAEDNPLNAEILEVMLEMQGASCTVCHDGKEIVEKFKTVRPGEYDAILMDVQMPVMDGYDAPYVYQRDGSPEGMIISILNDFSTETGVSLHYTFAESRSEADKMLDDGKYDMIIGFQFDSDYCAEHGFIRSEAINDKKVDAAAGDRSIMEYYIYETASRLTTTLITGETQKISVGVSKKRGTGLMEILNRYINSLSDAERTQYLSDGNTHDSSGALVRYIRQYPARAAAIISILTAFVACGAFMMFYAQRMNRKNKELP